MIPDNRSPIRDPHETHGRTPQPSGNSHDVRKPGSTSLRKAGQTRGAETSDIARDLLPGHAPFDPSRVQCRIKLSGIESKDLMRADVWQRQSIRYGFRVAGNEALRCSLEPAEHLQNAIPLDRGSIPHPGQSRHADWLCGHVLERCIDLARHLLPTQPTGLALRIECGEKSPNIEISGSFRNHIDHDLSSCVAPLIPARTCRPGASYPDASGGTSCRGGSGRRRNGRSALRRPGRGVAAPTRWRVPGSSGSGRPSSS